MAPLHPSQGSTSFGTTTRMGVWPITTKHTRCTPGRFLTHSLIMWKLRHPRTHIYAHLCGRTCRQSNSSSCCVTAMHRWCAAPSRSQACMPTDHSIRWQVRRLVAQDLLALLLKGDVAARMPSMAAVMEHPYFMSDHDLAAHVGTADDFRLPRHVGNPHVLFSYQSAQVL